MNMADRRREIPPNPPRWQLNTDPASIQVPGLDTAAPVLDQIEQIEQLITIKLQVSFFNQPNMM
jgi:DASH complex subunit ASK1